MWQERCGACLLFSVALLGARRHVLFISLSLPCSSRRALWHRSWLWRLRSRPPWFCLPRPQPSLPPSQCSLHSRQSPRPLELLSHPRSVSSATLPSSHPPPLPPTLHPKGWGHCHSCQEAGCVTSSDPDPQLHHVTQLAMDKESCTCPHMLALIHSHYCVLTQGHRKT